MSFAFIDAPLDRAEYLRNDPARLRALWPDARVLPVDADGQALTAEDGAPLLLDGRALGDLPEEAVLLGLEAVRAWFALPAARLEGVLADAGSAGRIDLRAAAAAWPAREATAFAQARAVLHWRARHRHCGACGGALAYARAGWLGRCTQCGIEHYPRTDPAVIVAVGDGERLLLGRQANWPPRRYSTLAGFVEPGETLEQTVVREVYEESGVRVRRCRYLASQPWPFPSSLMLGFIAEAEPDEPRVNDDELEDVRWFDRDEIDAALRGSDHGRLLLSPRLSISRWLIERWHAGDAGDGAR